MNGQALDLRPKNDDGWLFCAGQYQYGEEETGYNEISQQVSPQSFKTPLQDDADNTVHVNVEKEDVQEFIYGNVPVSPSHSFFTFTQCSWVSSLNGLFFAEVTQG